MSSPGPSANQRRIMQDPVGTSASMQKQLPSDTQERRKIRMHKAQQTKTQQKVSSSAVRPDRRHTGPPSEERTTFSTRARSAPPSEAKVADQEQISPTSEKHGQQKEHRINQPAAVAKDQRASSLPAEIAPASSISRAGKQRARSSTPSQERLTTREEGHNDEPSAGQRTAPSVRAYAQAADVSREPSSSTAREKQSAPSSEADRPSKRVKSDIAPWMTQRHKRAIRRSLEAASASTSSSPTTSPAKQTGSKPAEDPEQQA